MIHWVALDEKSPVSNEMKSRAASALIDAEAHVLALGDQETTSAYTLALTSAKDDRVFGILWSFVDRDIARGQAAVALTWFHAPADSAKLAKLPPLSHPVVLPEIERMLLDSKSISVQTGSARELIMAGIPSGFAFVAEIIIEQDQPYRQEMIQFLRDRFAEIRQADDNVVLEFAKMKSQVR